MKQKIEWNWKLAKIHSMDKCVFFHTVKLTGLGRNVKRYSFEEVNSCKYLGESLGVRDVIGKSKQIESRK